MNSKFCFILFFIPQTLSITFNCLFLDKNFCTYNCNQCKAVNMIITKPNQNVTKIFGYNGNSVEVDVLKIHDQLIRYLPNDLNLFFPNLQSLQIWSCGLKSLSQKDISAFTELREISVSRNEIEVLNSDLFEANQNILKIDFSRNRLKHVGFNILRPLKGLLFADFYQNDCINEGNHNGIESLIKNLRRKCKPTVDMMVDDVKRLNRQVELLETELMACEKIHRNRRCDGESLVTLDTLFPSIFIGEENKIENF